MAAGGARDVTGSFITALACGLFALTAYASGVLISQLSTSARSGTALAVQFSSGLAGLYLLTNVSDELGPVGVVRFVSPFHYFNASRALVPDQGLDLPSGLALIAMTVTMLGAAASAQVGQDLGVPGVALGPGGDVPLGGTATPRAG